MLCPKCGHYHTEVIRTTHNDRDNLILRRRKCLKCEFRFSTNERLREEGKKLMNYMLKAEFNIKRD